MARLPSSWSSSDLQCEDPQCPNPYDSKDVFLYGVRETKNLCRHCAAKKSREGVILPRVHGRRRATFCDQHGERPAEWFCDSHNVALCQDCKVSSHQGCTLQEATFRLQKRLSQLLVQKQEELRGLDAMLQKRISKIDDQFKEKEQAIRAAQQEKERVRSERRLLGSRRAKRAEHVLRTNADTEDNERRMDEEEAKECLRQLNEGRRRASRLEMKVKEQCKQCLDETQAAAEQIKQLLDDNRSMDEVRSTMSALEDILQLSVDTHLMDVAEEFTRGIRYRRGSTSDIGLVEGCKRSLWYLSDSITLPKKIDNPRIRSIDNTEVAVLDRKDKVVYRVNPQSKNVQKLGDDRPITDFIRWQDDKIVCIDDGGIDMSVYSRQWQYLQGISHPGLVFENLTVGSCGNLLVRADGRRVYAIKPTDMKIQPKNFICINIDNIRDLVGLPSGHLIVKQHESTFIVLDEKGTRRSLINEKNWTSANVAVDRTTGSPYVVYLDKKRKDFAMCRITVAGAVVAEDVPDLRQRLDSSLPFHLDVFESKKLFICNGNKLFVFTMMSADDS